MYHPTGRVLAVLELLQSRPSISGSQLAERLELDVRTIRRYILKLQDAGIPVESIPGRYGGYRLRPGFRMPPLVFSDDEAIAVLVGLIANPWMSLSLPRNAVESALSKITRVLPKSTWDRVRSLTELSVLSPESTVRGIPVATLLRISQAVADRSCISLAYQTHETTERTVEPYGVAGFQGRWYLVGFCRLRKDLRVFRLDRIGSFSVLSERFQGPDGFDTGTYLRERLKKAQRWRIHIRFDAPEDGIRLLYGDVGEITAVDGGHDYVGPASDLDYVARTLLFSELSFHVLAPSELKAALRRIADRAGRSTW